MLDVIEELAPLELSVAEAAEVESKVEEHTEDEGFHTVFSEAKVDDGRERQGPPNCEALVIFSGLEKEADVPDAAEKGTEEAEASGEAPVLGIPVQYDRLMALSPDW